MVLPSADFAETGFGMKAVPIPPIGLMHSRRLRAMVSRRLLIMCGLRLLIMCSRRLPAMDSLRLLIMVSLRPPAMVSLRLLIMVSRRLPAMVSLRLRDTVSRSPPAMAGQEHMEAVPAWGAHIQILMGEVRMALPLTAGHTLLPAHRVQFPGG